MNTEEIHRIECNRLLAIGDHAGARRENTLANKAAGMAEMEKVKPWHVAAWIVSIIVIIGALALSRG